MTIKLDDNICENSWNASTMCLYDTVNACVWWWRTSLGQALYVFYPRLNINIVILKNWGVKEYNSAKMATYVGGRILSGSTFLSHTLFRASAAVIRLAGSSSNIASNKSRAESGILKHKTKLKCHHWLKEHGGLEWQAYHLVQLSLMMGLKSFLWLYQHYITWGRNFEGLNSKVRFKISFIKDVLFENFSLTNVNY